MTHTSKSFTFKLIALALLAAALAVWPTPAGAIVIVNGKFGMVGIVQGQTARLNVVNSNLPDGDRNARPCSVELMFLDSMGMMLGETMRVSLMPGHAAFLDFMFDTDRLPGLTPGIDTSIDNPNSRLQLRGVVGAQSPPDPDRPGRQLPPGSCAGLIATLEVFNTETGQTFVIIPGQAR